MNLRIAAVAAIVTAATVVIFSPQLAALLPSAAPKDAGTVASGLTQSVKSMKVTRVYTAADDPNHMMGEPNGYKSKATFTDSNVPGAAVEFSDADSVDRGGSVEVFTDDAGAMKRADCIHALSMVLPDIGEYLITNGPVLVRVSRFLTPDQAAAYQPALQKALG